MKFLIILLAFVSCAHKSSLKDVDVDLYQMTSSQINSLPDDLWPGFKEYNPLVIYNTIEGQYLLGADKYPVMGFNKYNKDHKHPLGQKFQKRVYNTAFPKEIFQKHYPTLTSSVFMIDSLERMKSLGRNWNIYDWSTIYIHEIFHLFQGPIWSKEIIGKKENIDSTPLQKLKKDKKNIKLVVEEQKIVRSALLKLDFTNKKEIKEMCKSLITKRDSRYKYLKRQIQHSVKNEQFYETLEGTTRYIEKHIDLYSISDSNKRKYMNKDLLAYLDKHGIKTYYYMLHQIEPGENYYYETGFGLSLLLDKLEPKWKNKAFKSTLWEQVTASCNRI
ncbi:hypothetical protein HBN50_14470 [Halobacteriovorax sp. GB3]|uniref:hypothetical protein n=1 Tax=Halobacteriovorax sp. GB3 TaxID=2719615 RepID=UPI002361BAB8|nr:hypothetical protein [Halobacteriovorax sp. GB3]MDD0854313.1 hypothetical protein [Halobacteriovorax sp. GB3]